jgi:hypothetical protein
MKNESIRLKIIYLFMVITLFVLPATAAYSKTTDVNEKTDIIRFDALIKLNSKNMLPDTVLFARYWVSPDFYSISIIWAEPSAGNFNYPVIFQSFIINSDETGFSTNSRTIKEYSVSITKPIEERGPFISTLGSYPIDNVRFAEQEAIASRIYKKDIGDLNDKTNNETRSVEIADSNNANVIKPEAAKIMYKASDGNISNLKLIGKNNQIIKDIEYKYVQKDGNSILKSQKVILPEKIMQVGFRGQGVTIYKNGKPTTFKELPAIRHTGGRICNIEYDPIPKINEKMLVVPSSITVQRADSNNIMRSAKISNVEKLKMSLKEVQQEAQQYGRISDDELYIKKLLEKLLQQNNTDVEDKDVGRLERLRSEYDKTDAKTTAEKLKLAGNLINLDWVQSDKKLAKDFKNYLSILKEKNPSQSIIMNDGLNTIDLTVVLGRFSDADEIVIDWLDSFMAETQYNEIIDFAQKQIKLQHCWTIYKMLEGCLKSNKNLANNRFDVQAVKTTILNQFYTDSKSQNKSRRLKSQIEWASKSINPDEMPKVISRNIEEAERLFDDLKEPTKTQIDYKRQLDKIKQTMGN